MLISQFCSILSITAGVILLCVTSNFTHAKPISSRRLYPLSRKIVKCEQPHLKNGIARLKRKMVKFECSRGYKIMGALHAECSNGKWDTPVPVCAKKGCPKLDAPEHGFFIEEGNGLKMTLFCKDTYQTAGNIVAYCDGEMWDRELGTCRETSMKPQLWCDFETEDLCRWTHDDSDDFDWKRFTTFQANTIHTGPKFDHTYKEPMKGHYMLLESTDGVEDERARLISPLYDPGESVNACFSLNYYMYGANVGTLSVYVKPLSIGMDTVLQDDRYLFFVLSGNQRNVWHSTIINIDQYNEPFQIIVEGSPGSGHLGDIAIDDVAIFQGTRCGKEEAQINETKTEITDNRETIFDYQSCKARCDETNATEGGDQIQAEGIIKKCDCHPDCEDSKTCCPDYRSICVFNTNDSLGSDTIFDNFDKRTETTFPDLLTTIQQPTIESGKETIDFKTNSVLPTKPTVKINTKLVYTSQIIKQNTSTTPKLSFTTSTPDIKAVTRLLLHSTTKTILKTSSMSTEVPKPSIGEVVTDKVISNEDTEQSEVYTEASETSNLPVVMMHDDPNISDIVDIHILQELASEKENTDPGPFPLVAILFSLLVISIILFGSIFALKYYHRNYGPENYKKNADMANRRQDHGTEEYSDVLYLTEQIDFTLQTQQS